MIFVIPFLIPLLCCCCSSILILCLFGDKIFGSDKMNMIWSSISSSYCLLVVCCVMALGGIFMTGSKVIDTAGRSFDNL